MILTHKQNSSNQIVVPAERQFPQIFSAATRKLQNTDIKLIEAPPIVSRLATQFKQTKNEYEKVQRK
jgi:hypothetical protein